MTDNVEDDQQRCSLCGAPSRQSELHEFIIDFVDGSQRLGVLCHSCAENLPDAADGDEALNEVYVAAEETEEPDDATSALERYRELIRPHYEETSGVDLSLWGCEVCGAKGKPPEWREYMIDYGGYGKAKVLCPMCAKDRQHKHEAAKHEGHKFILWIVIAALVYFIIRLLGG